VIGAYDVDMVSNEKLARKLCEETVFPRDDPRMFFTVREGSQRSNVGEGFCKEMLVTSEMLNGESVVDSWFHSDLSIGD